MASIPQLVTQIKQADQDFEWYPTTNEIIQAMLKDLEQLDDDENAYLEVNGHYHRIRDRIPKTSALDIGAGNGKVLAALKEAGFDHLHAIEKSSILCRELPTDVMIVGTDFHEQSLLSKAVDLVFCNPPYSEFEQWAEKIIREAAAQVLYLVLPVRWQQSARLQDALKFRDTSGRRRQRRGFNPDVDGSPAVAHIVGTYDFENAERAARAKVHLIRIYLGSSAEDAFNRFFEEQFKDVIDKYAQWREARKIQSDDEKEAEAGHNFRQLVVGPNYPEAMVQLFDHEMAHIQRNYHLVGQLDPGLLKEFEIDPDKIRSCLSSRITNLRNDYWKELFSRLTSITDRLTSKSRSQMLDRLHKHVHVDFTVSNILEIIVWVIRNANSYLESQFLDVYENMVEKANVKMYKSNQRVWTHDRWRYANEPENRPTHFALDYRIVTHSVGSFSYYSDYRRLEDRAWEFLTDLLTIGRNLGFNCDSGAVSMSDWQPGVPQEFYFRDKRGGHVLYEARAFKNRNIHLRFNKEFMLAMNVEHGRLKGWLRTAKEAVEELGDKTAAKYFNSYIQLTAGNCTPLLAAPAPEPEPDEPLNPQPETLNPAPAPDLFALVA